MSAVILDGKALAAKLREGIAARAAAYERRAGKKPGLAVILAGDDPASAVYVRNKVKGCEEAGIRSFSFTYPGDVAEEELLRKVAELNKNPDVHGILVQLPLPKHIDSRRVLNAIAADKDADGFLPESEGRLLLGLPGARACTPAGCMELLASCGLDLCGKHAVVVGRSNIVGKPVALMLLEKNCTVTIAHSKTENLAELTRQADVLVAAVGKAGLIRGDMVKPGAAVIDVGMNRVNGKLCGDVDFDSVKEVAGYLTPVPGGVGPMTITMLLQNTVAAAERGNG